MKARIVLFTFLVVAVCACKDNDSTKENLNATDKNFVQRALTANKTEIQFGKLAASKGMDDMVKQFGNRMQQEHGEALTDLQQIANNYGNVTISNNNSDTSALKDMDLEHQQMYMKLQNQTPPSIGFDSSYVASQIADHQKAIALFQAELDSGSRQDIKSYVNKYLPHIQMHLASADSIANALRVKHGPNNGTGDTHGTSDTGSTSGAGGTSGNGSTSGQ